MPQPHDDESLMPSTRSVLVEAPRLEGWLGRFGRGNGPYTVRVEDAHGVPSIRLLAANGCSALLTPPLPWGTASEVTGGEDLRPTDDAESPLDPLLDRLIRSVPPVTVGILLIRRGGYSVGLARDGEVVASKTGTRYVQGKTAAGGWSQQRFARRRANQADALVEETAARAADLFTAGPPSALQLGGDRTLAANTLAEPVLKAFAHLPQVPFQTVPDPRFTILKDVARSALSIRITVTDPPAKG
jgi:hypothetical protein